MRFNSENRARDPEQRMSGFEYWENDDQEKGEEQPNLPRKYKLVPRRDAMSSLTNMTATVREKNFGEKIYGAPPRGAGIT
jgi:hypothetical protein